jgi:hypothetical protein
MPPLPGNGFENGAAEPAFKQRPVALVLLIATLALALSTLIAVTAVSIGFARAEAAWPVALQRVSAS